jgi:hypothetical protein
MNSRNLPGLSPVAIMTFALAVIALVSIGLPISLQVERLGDWLGFAGSLIGATITLGAAVAAWYAVQSQIAEQRRIADRQLALQSYGVLHDLAATLENELRLALKLSSIARATTAIDELRAVMPVNIVVASNIASRLKKANEDLESTRHEWEIADTKRWQFPSVLDARMEFEGSIVELADRLVRHCATFDLIALQSNSIKDPQTLLDAITFTEVASQVLTKRAAYTTKINVELARLLPKLERLRREGDL